MVAGLSFQKYRPIFLALLAIALFLVFSTHKASAAYSDLPGQLPMPTEGYTPNIHLSTKTNDPQSGAGAFTNSVAIKVYTDTLSTRTVYIQFRGAASGDTCQDLVFHVVRYQVDEPTNTLSTYGSAFDLPPTNFCTVNTVAISIPQGAFQPSNIPGREGVYVAALRIALTSSDATATFWLNTSDTRARLGFMGVYPYNGGQTSNFIDPNGSTRLQNTAFSVRGGLTGNYNVEERFAPPCTYFSGPADSKTAYVYWKDADSETQINPAKVTVTFTDLTDGSGNWGPINALSGSSIYSHAITMKYGHKYSIKFEGMEQRNGLRIWYPFDSAGSAFDCAPPNLSVDHKPSGIVTANCSGIRIDWLDDQEKSSQNVHYVIAVWNKGDPVFSGTSESGRGLGTVNFTNMPTLKSNDNGYTYLVQVYNVGLNRNDYGNYGNVDYADINPASGEHMNLLYSGDTGRCYSAHCSVSVNSPVSADPQLPGGGVIAGQAFTLTATFWNDGPTPTDGNGFGVTFNNSPPDNGDWTWGQPSGQYIHYPMGGGTLYPTESRSFNIALTAPNDRSSRTINFYPDDIGNFPVGGYCPVTITTYQRFDIGVNPNFVGVDWQDPSPSISYNIIGNKSGPSPSISTNSYAWLTKASLGGNPVTGGIVDGKHGPNPHTYGTGIKDGDFTYPYPKTVNGDQFCAWGQIDIGHGWYGPSGPAPGYIPEIQHNCEKVTNKPYFKVYGSSISAGGNFRAASGGSCSGGGELAGWFNNMNSATYSYGSSAALSALALKQIVGFGSAQNVGVFGRSPTELTLANTTPVNASNYSPNLAGAYDSDPITVNRCLTSQQAGPSATAVGNTASVDTLDRSNTGTGPFILTGGTVPSGKNVSLFVDGDVYIDPGAVRGIKYADTGWTKDTVPSFVLHATGNIYISPEVTVLDGLYVSEPSSSASPKGTIYTCAKRSSFSFSAMSVSELYNGCKNQLTVHGSFVAKKINLMRSFGSLRDEKPTVSTPTIVQVGTGAVGFTRWTCPVAGQQWNHWYQVLSSPAQPSQPGCSTGWYLNKPERTMGYVLPSTRVGQDGSARLCYHGSSSWDAASTGSDFRYYTTPNNCSSGDSVIGAAQRTNGSASGAPLIPVYSTVLDGRHFYTTSYGEAGATAIAFYIYQNADGGALTTMATNVAPPNLGALVCSNAGLKSSPRQTCAAEVFDVSPELFISRQAIKQSNSSTGLWDSVTSLPPVL